MWVSDREEGGRVMRFRPWWQGSGRAFSALCIALLWGSAAHAEGPGIRSGDLVIHPSARVASGYDSNVFLESPKDAEPIKDAFVLHVGGGVKLHNRNPNRVELRLDTDLTYRHYIAIHRLEPNAEDLVSSRNAISDARAAGLVGLNPKGTVSLEIVDTFVYSERPPYSERDGLLASQGKTRPTAIAGYQRLDNSAGADLVFRPGEGELSQRALELRFGYRYHLVHYVDGELLGAARANLNAHEMSLISRWRFLPKTALELDVRYHINDYQETQSRTAPGHLEAAQTRDSTPLWALAGLRGLLTQRLSAVLRLGYSNTFNEAGASYSGLLAHAELQYLFEPVFNVRLGFRHEALPSAFANYVAIERAYLQMDLNLSKLTLMARGEFGYYEYSTSGAPSFRLGGVAEGGLTIPQRNDPVVRVGANAHYHFFDWLALGVDWTLEANLTDYSTPRDETSQAIPDYADYTRHLVMGQLRFDY